MTTSFLKSTLVAGILCSFSLLSGGKLEIVKGDFQASSKLGDVRLFHDKNGFQVVEADGSVHEVQNCFVDKQVRNISNKKLGYFLGILHDVEVNGVKETVTKIKLDANQLEKAMEHAQKTVQVSPEAAAKYESIMSAGSYLTLNKMDDGEYVIRAKSRGLGGGYWGGVAGFLLGKSVVHIMGQGVIYGVTGVVGIFCPPAAPVVYAGLQVSLVPAFEVASNTVGLGTGVVGMLLTGPV